MPPFNISQAPLRPQIPTNAPQILVNTPWQFPNPR